jgi:hypothetical protein
MIAMSFDVFRSKMSQASALAQSRAQHAAVPAETAEQPGSFSLKISAVLVDQNHQKSIEIPSPPKVTKGHQNSPEITQMVDIWVIFG